MTPNLTETNVNDELVAIYERMQLIRSFETRAAALYRDGLVPGFVHLSTGQEAAAVGACWPLANGDVITSTHRGHGHCLAKGLDPGAMFAELMGRETGSNRGRGGSMHIADPSLGIFGANGIVGAGLPIAIGAALAAHGRGQGDLVVAFFGDGAVASGAFHESVNLAALWRLPVVFFCENNNYAEFSATASQQPVDLATRARGYGLPHIAMNGNDVVEVVETMRDAYARVRSGGGPIIAEAVTYRWAGHYEGDPERYRDAAEVQRWQDERDPIAIVRGYLVERSVPATRLDEIDVRVAASIDEAVEIASRAPEPRAADVALYTYHASPTFEETSLPTAPADVDGDRFRLMDAIHDALEERLENDPRVFLAGIDIGDAGNVFGITRGLKARWPTRVLDTPISETAISGLAVGAAMAGLNPVIELMYLDFIGVCFDQLLNQAAKLSFMTGGKASLGLTIRTQFGAGRSSGSQHSQSLESLLAHVPGLRVVMPSNPVDAYGLLRASIIDPNPVVFIENRQQYGMRGARPPRDHFVPLGRARLAREGDDLTIVTYSAMTTHALHAADRLAADGIQTDVIDLRTVAPIDFETIETSVRTTGRLLIVHEAVTRHGLGAEIAAQVADRCFWNLDAPIRRLGAPFSPPPYAPSLERAWLPDVDAIVKAATELVRL